MPYIYSNMKTRGKVSIVFIILSSVPKLLGCYCRTATQDQKSSSLQQLAFDKWMKLDAFKGSPKKLSTPMKVLSSDCLETKIRLCYIATETFFSLIFDQCICLIKQKLKLFLNLCCWYHLATVNSTAKVCTARATFWKLLELQVLCIFTCHMLWNKMKRLTSL